MCIVLKSVQLYTPVATCMYQMCHIPRQDVIESDRIKNVCVCVCVCGGGGDVAIKLSIIMHFLCGRSRTGLKNASEIWNLDLNLDLYLAKIWISIASNKMLI